MSRLNLLRSLKKKEKKKRHQHISFTHIFISFTFIMQPVTMGTLEDIRRGSLSSSESISSHTDSRDKLEYLTPSTSHFYVESVICSKPVFDRVPVQSNCDSNYIL